MDNTMREHLVREYFLKYKWNILLLSLVLLVGVGLDVYTAFLIQGMTEAASALDSERLRLLIGIGAVYLAVLFTDYYFEIVLSARFRNSCMTDLRARTFSRVMSMNQNEFAGSNTAHYLSVLNEDVTTAVSDYLDEILPLIFKFILMVSAVGVLIFYNPVLALIDIFISVAGILIPQLFGRKLEGAQRGYTEARERITAVSKDMFQGYYVVKSYGVERQVQGIFERANKDAGEKYKRRFHYQGLAYAGTESVSWLVFILHMVTCVILVLKGHLTLPVMIASTQILNHVVQPVSAISSSLALMKAAKAANRRVTELLETKEIPQKLTPVGHVLPLTVQNLSVSYDGESDALQDVSFTFEPGRKYVIVGSSGSGKSTLLKSILKYFPKYRGAVLYDSMEAKDVDKNSLNGQIAYLQQEVIIFNGTISENITMFQKEDKERLQEAIERSGLKEVVARFPEGTDGMLGENGGNLSGGERQRISIARALYKGASLFLVDEVTASLDNTTAQAVEHQLLSENGKTVISVSHRLDAALLKEYDQILVFREGRLAETGRFDELMEKKECFYALFRY